MDGDVTGGRLSKKRGNRQKRCKRKWMVLALINLITL